MTSMDELPQLLNVLGGQMSLVGSLALPPPSAADVSAKSETPILRRPRHLKPGISRSLQINGRLIDLVSAIACLIGLVLGIAFVLGVAAVGHFLGL